MLEPLDRFLAMDPADRCVYQVGRRMGVFSRLSDMESPHRLRRVRQAVQEHGITPDNVDDVIAEMMKRFI
jgi:hypothetical protein